MITKYLLLKVVVDFLDPLLATEVLLLEVVDILSGFRDRRRCIDVTVSSANEQFSIQFKIQKEKRIVTRKVGILAMKKLTTRSIKT